MIAPFVPLALSLRSRLGGLAAQLTLIALLIPAAALVWLHERWIERRTRPSRVSEPGAISAAAACLILGSAVLLVGLVLAGSAVFLGGGLR